MRKLGFIALLAVGTVAIAAAQDDKLQIHGFFSQAYAVSNENVIFGIDEDGTWDYRNVALQFSYAFSESDSVVVQLAHARVGVDPAQDLKDEIELDWGFWEHRFNENFSTKLGRSPLPFGIFNEIRDVGTLLPFYRPSVASYSEAAFATEALDGLVVTGSFGSDWSLDVDAYVGSLRPVVQSATGGFVEARGEDTVGIEVWLDTPVDGLRFGAGSFSYDFDAVGQAAGFEGLDGSHLSAEFVRGGFRVRAESMAIDLGATEYAGGYAQIGYTIDERWAFDLQLERADLDLATVVFIPDFGPLPVMLDVDFLEETILGVRYFIDYNIVLKAEWHITEGYAQTVPTPNFIGPPVETDFGILSASVSF